MTQMYNGIAKFFDVMEAFMDKGIIVKWQNMA